MLNEIRFLVGTHLGLKGLPPSIIAPVLNILGLLDGELRMSGFILSPEIDSEVKRLQFAIVTMNSDETEDEDQNDDDFLNEDEDEEDDYEDEEEDDYDDYEDDDNYNY
jgi:hypothetical protein